MTNELVCVDRRHGGCAGEVMYRETPGGGVVPRCDQHQHLAEQRAEGAARTATYVRKPRSTEPCNDQQLAAKAWDADEAAGWILVEVDGVKLEIDDDEIPR
ncbi:hypothetical protein AB0I84_07440 [Streptomyces spectabilis]|uniref:hypothetical protein n=1 Tax=Streptomyces spectabilis TaxID=68270 RepID=UPI0034077FA6